MLRFRWIASAVLLVGLIFAVNAFGRDLNALALRYPGIDKVLHFTVYAALFVCFRAVTTRIVPSSRHASAIAWGVGLLLSVADESVQSLFPARTVEFGDLLVDWAGLATGWALGSRFTRLAIPVLAASLLTAGYVTGASYFRMRDYATALQYERRHDFVRAREYYLKALNAGVDTPGFFNGLAWVELESGVGDPEAAVRYAARALERRPTDPDVLDTYGWALHRAGRHAEALSYLQRAYAGKPDMYCIHYHLGAVYASLSQHDKAREHFLEQLQHPRTREAGLAEQALRQPVRRR